MSGLPYREINKQTGVSVTTIGRVARYLTSGNGGYHLASDRLNAHSGGRANGHVVKEQKVG
jgi:uncharacterized protein YerC